jgi:ABC-2 type transport system permease protein
MNRALIRKNIGDGKWLLLGCTVALFAFCWMRVWLISLVDMHRFQQILDLLPGDWQRFSPVDFDWLVTYTGRIALTYDEPLVVLCMILWVIARGSDVVSGELGRGTMEMLLAQPLSRMQVLMTHSTVTVVGIVILALASWAGIVVGVETTMVTEQVRPTFNVPLTNLDIPIPFAELKPVQSAMSEKVDNLDFLPAVVNFFALGLFLAGLTTLVSSWDRYRWRTIGIVVTFYIAFTIVKIAGMAADHLAWLKYVTIFTAFEPEVFVAVATNTPEQTWSLFLRDEAGAITELGPTGYNLILIVTGLFAYALAARVFARRDLPAPL